MRIQAIETEYAGCRFRSRLEARWAVFFDALRIPWEHEPDGFETSFGKYLPDFKIRIPQTEDSGHYQWFEVKPDEWVEDRRHADLASRSGVPLIVARGMPRSYDDQLKAWRSPLTAYGLGPDDDDPRVWPVAFCDSTSIAYFGSTSALDDIAFYCSLGDNRHWCQEHMQQTLNGWASCHLAIYGEHKGGMYGDGYMTRPPYFARNVDRAYRLARSERFGT